MSEKTKIQWCDSTVNFWEGCTKVSTGCLNCYAEARDRRQMIEPVMHWGKGAPRRKSKSAVKQALTMNRKPWVCDYCGTDQRGAATMDEGCENENCASNISERVAGSYHRRRVFSLSLGDWLDPEVPIEWLAEMLDTIRQCDQLTWILCTKRPELWRERLEMCRHLAPCVDEWLSGVAPKNIWILTSVENQEMADKRIPELLKIPAVVHGLSCEPLLGPIDLNLSKHFLYGKASERLACGNYETTDNPSTLRTEGNKIDWVIVGGESGKQARPCNVEWIRNIVEQCKAANIPVFVKQDSGPKSGMQGRIPNDIFNTKEFPNA